jgi:hypothetical protein
MVMGLALSLVPQSVPVAPVRAQDVDPPLQYSVYVPLALRLPIRGTFIPMLSYRPKMLEENFVTDPGWKSAYLKDDPKDGTFEHSPESQTLLGHVTDNSALFASWPSWQVSGDFMLEVDARHLSPLKKSFNGLGLIFNLEVNEDKPTNHDFYALMLAMGAAQNFWTVAHFTDTDATYLTNSGYRGGPNFMNDWDEWNQLEIRVIDGAIYSFCNDKWLPGGIVEAHEVHMVAGRVVGVVLTSYEFDNGEMEFDNFKLTRIYPGDPEYDEVIERRAQMSTAAIEFDTPALDLH